MTTASHAASHQPAWLIARIAGALVIVSGAIANSLHKPHRSPFDVVIWTIGLVGAPYACVLVVSALASRPLPSRTLFRLEGLALLIVLPVAVWAAVAEALSSQWNAAAVSALVAAVNGGMLWLVSRQLRALPRYS
jgi:hypothetical protein